MAVSLSQARLANVVEVEPIFCREPDALRILGNPSRETLWKWRRAGHIEAVKYGTATFYVVESLKAFAERLRADGHLDRIA
jgi:hypothetical protein